jgi:serine transporter
MDKLMKNKLKVKCKDTREWSFLFLGSALGAGILFLPLQAGKVSIYSTLLTIVVALIGTYIGQKLMIRMIVTTTECTSYDHAIGYHLGKYPGILLSCIFLIFLFSIMVLLGTGINNNFADMLRYYNVINITALQKNPVYTLVLLACLAMPLIIGEKFLLSMLEKVVSFKIIILTILVFMFIPLWKSENIQHYTYFSFGDFGMGLVTLMPVLIFGATFFPSIGSMGRYFRTEYSDLNTEELYKVTNKTNIYAMILLFLVLVVFITSALFALSPGSLLYAGTHNLSALAVIGRGAPTGFFADYCVFAGYLITVLAILTSYYAVIIGLIDGIISRVPYADKINRKIIIVLIHFLLWVWIVKNINILVFIERIVSPLIVLYVFFIPFFAAYFSKKMGKHKHFVSITCFLIGLFLMIASFVAQ